MEAPAYIDRRHAGRVLAASVAASAHPDVLVLALPRGGVPVGYEISQSLRAPLVPFIVRKLGVPGQREFAFGAIASGGLRVIDEHVVQELNLSSSAIDRVVEQERLEIERREQAYGCTQHRPWQDRSLIVVDDGLATGATMHAAVAALRAHRPLRIDIAVPVASVEACRRLRPLVDELFCPLTPDPFHAVGIWYSNFEQTTDDEVRDLLKARFDS